MILCIHLKNHIFVLGFAKFIHKHLNQSRATPEFCYFYLLKQPYKGDVPNNLNFIIIPSNVISRVIKVVLLLINNRNTIHHIQVYPGGRLAWVYCLIGRILCLKVITVEQGDLTRIHQMTFHDRFSLFLSYKLATLVWYKEYYMKKRLHSLTSKPLFFVPNAISLPSIKKSYKKNIDFIWVNRMTKYRSIKWCIDVLKNDSFSKSVFIGFQTSLMHSGDVTIDDEIIVCEEYPLKHKSQYMEYYSFGAVDPFDFYPRARFFLFPSEYVFGNFSLLEAMSFGVVPLVSDVYGTNHIVQHEHNGIVFKHDYVSFKKAIEFALNLNDQDYERLSRNAVQTIRDDFSLDTYNHNLTNLYNCI